MVENKTKKTEASVETYLEAITDNARRQDCRDLIKLMTKVSKQPAKMWGTSIVGFGSYHYKYDSGREGDMCAVGFSSRKGAVSLYLRASSDAHAKLLAKLGKHKMGKGCVYLDKLADADPNVLEQLVALSIANIKHAR